MKIPERKILESGTELKAVIVAPCKVALCHVRHSLAKKSQQRIVILTARPQSDQWRPSVLVVIDF
jgi:hypothetical protein